MGGVITATTYRKAETPQELIRRFARLVQERYGGAVYLFGSRARGTATPRSDYDMVAVAEAFREQRPMGRAPDRLLLWFEAGGWGEELDLHCYIPEEFRGQIAGGVGYLGQARRRGELIPMAGEDATTKPRRTRRGTKK